MIRPDVNEIMAAHGYLCEGIEIAENQCGRRITRIPELTWSSKMIATHALANYRKRTIRIATIHWRDYSPVYRREVIFHELAHILAIDLYGKSAAGHGRGWQSVMRILGYPGARVHARPGEGNAAASAEKRASTYRFRARCACSIEHELSARKAMTIRRGRHYRCTVCRQRLVLLDSQPSTSQPSTSQPSTSQPRGDQR